MDFAHAFFTSITTFDLARLDKKKRNVEIVGLTMRTKSQLCDRSLPAYYRCAGEVSEAVDVR